MVQWFLVESVSLTCGTQSCTGWKRTWVHLRMRVLEYRIPSATFILVCDLFHVNIFPSSLSSCFLRNRLHFISYLAGLIYMITALLPEVDTGGMMAWKRSPEYMKYYWKHLRGSQVV